MFGYDSSHENAAKDQRSRITMNLTAYDDVSGAHYVDGMHVTRRFILCFMLAVNV